MGRVIQGVINNQNTSKEIVPLVFDNTGTKEIVYVDRIVEVPVEKEVIKEVEKIVYIDKPFETIKEVEVIKKEYVRVEKLVPKEIIKEVEVIKEIEKIVKIEDISRILEEKSKVYKLNHRINKMWMILILCTIGAFVLGRISG